MIGLLSCASLPTIIFSCSLWRRRRHHSLSR